MEAPVPLGHDGLGLPRDIDTIGSLILTSSAHWSRRREELPASLSVTSLLEQDAWDETCAHLSAVLIYRSSRSCTEFAHWLIRQNTLPSLASFALVLHAFLDSVLIRLGSGGPMLPSSQRAVRVVIRNFGRLLDTFLAPLTTLNTKHLYGSCLLHLLKWPSMLSSCATILQEKLESIRPSHIFNVPTLSFFYRLAALKGDLHEEVTDSVVALGLQWVVRRFAEDEADSPELLNALEIFGRPHESHSQSCSLLRLLREIGSRCNRRESSFSRAGPGCRCAKPTTYSRSNEIFIYTRMESIY